MPAQADETDARARYRIGRSDPIAIRDLDSLNGRDSRSARDSASGTAREGNAEYRGLPPGNR